MHLDRCANEQAVHKLVFVLEIAHLYHSHHENEPSQAQTRALKKLSLDVYAWPLLINTNI